MKSPRVKAVLGVLQVAKSKSLRRWKELVRGLTINSASMRENLTLLHATNKGADKPVHMRRLIHAFVVRCLESTLTTLE